MAAASSSVPLFGVREEEDEYGKQPPQPKQQPLPAQPAAPPPKKKRKLPGNPYPDAEVIALSPRTLLATNRFVCEVCNKGFQREQNLQLHRRGHNLPWKLKQKNPKEARRRVYLCPEPTCVHHDPSRALGDLTGIKKHYCRKHGEKKWKCDKCSKRYAVQSDWKAHSKTCGTREYRCDCGTLFSRRDSFITHRAFCDALAQESARVPSGIDLYGNSGISSGLPQVNSQLCSLQTSAVDLLRLGGGGGGGATQFDHLTASAFRPPPPPQPTPFYPGGGSSQELNGDSPFLQNMPTNTNASCSPSSAAAAAGNLFNLGFFSNSRSCMNTDEQAATLFAGNLMSNNIDMNMSSLLTSSLHSESAAPQMSATALLQKAAQMGATSSRGCFGITYSAAGGSKHASLRDDSKSSGLGESSRTQVENENHLQNLMHSLANGSSGIFGGGNDTETAALGGFNPGLCGMDEDKLHRNPSSGAMGGSDRLTRDFLGVGSMMRSLQGGGMAQPERQLGIPMATVDSETKSGSCRLPYGDGSLLSRRSNP
ncbi:protein indeterminate-domain 5, chloroplastic-like [Musa acuminata AAA Group]|uniref:protein indeterminate-domain 5, chloroplastic-like n=1 Tax=Musa acuminata AAA Group TaxID=214697 RepID=UPI0031DE9CD0